MIDPMPELRRAHADFALGRADLGERGGEFRTRRAGERTRRRRSAAGRGESREKLDVFIGAFISWRAEFSTRFAPPASQERRGERRMAFARPLEEPLNAPLFLSPPAPLCLAGGPRSGAGRGPSRRKRSLTLKDTVPSITTTGEASVDVVPNIAILSLGVETERPTAADAANENAKATRRSSPTSRRRGSTRGTLRRSA